MNGDHNYRRQNLCQAVNQNDCQLYCVKVTNHNSGMERANHTTGIERAYHTTGMERTNKNSGILLSIHKKIDYLSSVGGGETFTLLSVGAPQSCAGVMPPLGLYYAGFCCT